MPKITKDEVLHIARISALTIYEDEIPALLSQLESVLSYAARVREISVSPTPDTCTVQNNVMREDIARPSSQTMRDGIACNAPDFQDSYFVVPAILEHHS